MAGFEADDRHLEWLMAALRDALGNLAATADDQIAYIEASRVSYDELALELDAVLGAVLGYNLVGDGAADALKAVDLALTHISGRHNAALWTAGGLRERAEWVEIRRLARSALADLG